MRYFFIFLANICMHTASAQSPYLSVKLNMDSKDGGSNIYEIKMKICDVKNPTQYSDWFSADTSRIDFAALNMENTQCGEYFFDDDEKIQLSGEKEEKKNNSFEFGNQVFAWEKILVFRITSQSQKTDTMYLILPMKYKSFISFVNLTDLVFQPEKVIFLNKVKASYKETRLFINQSLKKEKGIRFENYKLKDLL